MEDYEQPINELSVVTDTIAIQVADGVGGVQLCPALILGSNQALPFASKHIYSRLSAAASEVDEGVPDLILSLVSHENQLSSHFLGQVEAALAPLVSASGLWLISSGEYDDPLSRAASNTIRSVLPQAENPVEVLHLMINTYEDVLVQANLPMVDTSLNTLLLLSRKENFLRKGKLKAQAVVRLSHPPPALLIGVPSEHISTGMTPATQAAPILLSPSNDKRPLPVVLFAGSSTESLEELLIYIEHGVPVIILQDSCELCAILHRAALLYRTAQFEHKRFVSWLSEQLHQVGYQEVEEIVDTVIQLFSIALGEPQLIEFLDSDDIQSFSSKLLDLCVQCYSGSIETRQVVLLAGRLNQPSAISPLLSSETLDDDLMADLLCECVSHDDRVGFLASVLEARPQLNVTSNMLIRMANAADQHFYTTIILSHCMDYSSIPEEVDEQFAHDVNTMLRSLSFGVDDLFPTNFFTGDVLRKNTGEAIKILAIWCLLLHKPKLVRCLCAYSEEPLAFSLILSRIARSLSHEARDWYFYSDSLNQLAEKLSSSACSILDGVHEKTPQKAYQMVCQPIEEFHGATITQMAFQANCRSILAHETCQRWVHRLLYGHLQPRGFFTFLPAWLKILISAVFIFPIKFWISMRPAFTHSKDSAKSPTVALLDVSRQVQRRTRTYSVISGRSDALTNLTAPLSMNFPHQLTSGGESATPQSIIFPLNIEEPDNETNLRLIKKKRIRKWASPSLRLFYSTPIAKYWLSLVFRLLHICLMAYALLVPGCGNLYLDAVVWAWSFMWWMESLWVLNLRSQTTELSVMPWRVFDVIATFAFLLLLLLFKVIGESIISETFLLTSAYPAKILNAFFLLYWCYATLFYYIPLSDIFGPLMVRVKLMILRDFTNFLILIALVMASSGAAIQAVLYPDRVLTFDLLKSSLSWIWLSLFTTDLSSLHASQECKKSFLGAPKQFCSAVSEYANPSCPSQSGAAYIVVLEYFVLLKLIFWPILFAFFAKTAKAVDEEADKIWKFQLYTLVTDFSARPPLPPPLTPFFFIYMACCKARTHYFNLSLSNPDHPDSGKKTRVTMRNGSVYRNPSVPFKKNEFLSSFWRKTAIEHWKKENKKPTSDSIGSQVKVLQDQLRMLALTNSYKKQESFSQKENFTREYSENVERLVLPASETPWNVLLPKYSPPFYCKPAEGFPVEMARFVETASENNVTELKRAWRNRQIAEHVKSWSLSSSGFPLNPNGRQGIAGRGNHPKFGPNRRCYYIILVGTTKSEAKILLEEKNGIPNEAHPETGPRDEHLASLLRLTGIAEGDAQLLSMRRLDTSIIAEDHSISMSDTSPAHLDVQVVAHDDDTDNAWTEHDIWAISLRNRKVHNSMVGYRWLSVSSATSHISTSHSPLMAKALRIYGIF